MRSRISICGLLITILVTWGLTAFAQENPSEGGHAQWQAMRQVMIAACAGMPHETECPKRAKTDPATLKAVRKSRSLTAKGNWWHSAAPLS